MKKIIIFVQILVLFLVIAFTGCESDNEFLTEEPTTFYTTDNAFSTSAQIDQVLVGVYSQLRDLWANSTEAAWVFVFRGNGTDMFDVASIRRGNTFNNYGTINPDHSHFLDIYSAWYQIISKSNLALYAAELPQISWTSPAEKAYVIAQARFFRAFAYRNLGELFGGVPIVTEISKTSKYDFERSSRVETYQFAIDELLAIENDLPETTSSGGRLVRAAAQHNLCELYLALGIQLAADGNSSGAQTAYTSSISYGNKVIDGGIYSLINSRFGKRKSELTIKIPVYRQGSTSTPVGNLEQTTNHYWDLFQEGNVNFQDGNTECIWSIQTDYAAYKAEDGRARLPYSRTYGPVFRDGAKNHLTGTLEDVGGRGISQIIPTMYTRDIIYEDKWAADLRNSDVVFRRTFIGNVATSPYYQS